MVSLIVMCLIFLDSWAILREVVDYIYQSQDVTGDYIFMKDPAKAVMRMFKNTAEDVDEEEVDDEL
jgi:hypothetical protein